MSKLELCAECDQPTGRAGMAEDSLYFGYVGPFCEECFDEFPDKLLADNKRLYAKIGEAESELEELKAARCASDSGDCDKQAPASGEAVAWVCKTSQGDYYGVTESMALSEAADFGAEPTKAQPLYTTPPTSAVPEWGSPESVAAKADLFWNVDDMENGLRCPEELADHCSQDLQQGESIIVDVLMAKEFPVQQMKVWVNDIDEIEYEFLSKRSSPPAGDSNDE